MSTLVVETLLKYNADADIIANDCCSSLSYEAQNGPMSIAQILLRHNVEVYLWDKDGCSPLHVAARNGHMDIIKMLLQHNAIATICNYNRIRPDDRMMMRGVGKLTNH